MVVRNGEYVCLDGSIFSLSGMQSLYISRIKSGIVVQYLDGHRIEVRYDSKKVCLDTWKELLKEIPDYTDTNGYVSLFDTMIVRLDSVQHIEYDGIDQRFALLYKSGECFIFDFQTVTVTRMMFRKIVEHYFGENAFTSQMLTARSRMRADFWQAVTAEISGLIAGEAIPNKQYWTKVDSALISAEEAKLRRKK